MKFVRQEVQNLSKNIEDSIISYLESNSNAKFYHHPKWQKLILDEFKKKGLIFSYDYVSESGQIVGVFPNIKCKRYLFLTEIHSPKQSFMTPYGGPLCNNLKVFNYIIKESLRSPLIKKISLSLYPIYNDNSHYFSEINYDSTLNQETAILRIGKTEDEMLQLMSRNHKRNIKKYQKENIFTENSLNNLDSFYEIYSRHSKSNNLRPVSKNFINSILDKFNSYLITIKLKDRILGGTFFVEYKNTINAFLHAVDNNFVRTGCGYSTYWTIIKQSLGKEKIIDFTVIEKEKNEGIARFKLGWGSDVIQFINYKRDRYKFY